jgi:DNA-binding MarR family transcriptional regulator
MNNKNKLISDLAICFTKVHNKLNKLEKRSAKFGTNEKLFASEIHAIQAIGKKKGNTVTELCSLFGITKGAVSQIITKLEKKKYILKKRNKNYSKEINIFLTEKGWKVFNVHEEMHNKMDIELFGFMKTISEVQIKDFINIISNIEKYIDKFSTE